MPKSKAEKGPKLEYLGEVGVDSGQLLITDPCYVDSQWVPNQDPPNSYPRLKLTKTGEKKFVKERVNGKHFPFAWGTYADPAPCLGGLSVNEAVDKGLVETITPDLDQTGEYSYGGCCSSTLSDKGAGQLNYKAGHAGAGVAFRSGYGDGVYPVHGIRNEEGRIIGVIIDMGMTEAQKKVFKA